MALEVYEFPCCNGLRFRVETGGKDEFGNFNPIQFYVKRGEVLTELHKFLATYSDYDAQIIEVIYSSFFSDINGEYKKLERQVFRATDQEPFAYFYDALLNGQDQVIKSLTGMLLHLFGFSCFDANGNYFPPTWFEYSITKEPLVLISEATPEYTNENGVYYTAQPAKYESQKYTLSLNVTEGNADNCLFQILGKTEPQSETVFTGLENGIYPVLLTCAGFMPCFKKINISG